MNFLTCFNAWPGIPRFGEMVAVWEKDSWMPMYCYLKYIQFSFGLNGTNILTAGSCQHKLFNCHVIWEKPCVRVT